MKKTFSLLTMALLMLAVTPAVFAVSIGNGVGIDLVTEDFAPRVWLCGERTFMDDSVEPQLYNLTRYNNYAFEGESITWEVLVMDKNGKEKISDVYGTIGDAQGDGNEIEVNCVRTGKALINDNDPIGEGTPYGECEATILEEKVEWNSALMAVYKCTLTVETPDSMAGEYWLTIEAEDMDEEVGTMAQNEYWFFNPVLLLSIDADLTFTDVRPGSVVRSSTMLIGNDAEDGSGVILDMYISGTNFYDSESSGAMCPTSNVLDLSRFTYDVVSGASSANDMKIRPGDTIAQAGRILDTANTNNPGLIFGSSTLSEADPANMLAPGAEMSITFELDLPEPCNGDFDSGSFYFWGEAV